MLLLGKHVNKLNTMYESIIKETDEYELNCAQIFTYGPRSNKANSYEKNIAKIKNINIYIHSQYPMIAIWQNIETKYEIFEEMCLNCKNNKAKGIVMHIAHETLYTVKLVLTRLCEIAQRYNVIVYLEMTAAKSGKYTFDTFEKINIISNEVLNDNWKWCIDTAHLWCAGNVCVKTYKDMRNFLKNIKEGSIGMFHLNGCSTGLGSGRDIHEIAFSEEDVIWRTVKYEDSGVKALVDYAYKRCIPIILEVKRENDKEIKKLIKYIKDL